jgi:DNA mismatch repair protein MutS2
MKTANANTLLLFDELGDGTDPSFGAAMAQAVLEKLLDQKSTVIATTHYGDLKKFSESRKDTLSASMLFDEVKLEPLFKLSIGFPGSSYTFHIARKMGLNHEVIKRAETLSESEKVLYDRQLFKLEKKEKELHSQKMELVRAEQDLKKQVKDWNRLHLDMDLTRKKMRYEKTILLQEQIAEKEKELKLFKEELKNKKKLEELALEQTKLNEEKESTNLASKELYKQINKVNPNQKFAIGDRVQFIQTNAVGVIEKMNKDRVTVVFDHLKSTISTSELLWLPPEDDKKKTPTKKIITLDKNSSRELDIRGQFVYEAIADLDDFINRALLNNYPEIKIIHGKGKLRTEIIKHLQTFKSISKCSPALPEHGGEGVTYVHF